VLLFATLASREEDRDPIDDAIIAKANASREIVEAVRHYKVTYFKPFDPVSKRTEATVETDILMSLQFIGLVALYDPPREDSAETLKAAQFMACA
jgi:magnesium-transporting ATPase (P-type)